MGSSGEFRGRCKYPLTGQVWLGTFGGGWATTVVIQFELGASSKEYAVVAKREGWSAIHATGGVK